MTPYNSPVYHEQITKYTRNKLEQTRFAVDLPVSRKQKITTNRTKAAGASRADEWVLLARPPRSDPKFRSHSPWVLWWCPGLKVSVRASLRPCVRPHQLFSWRISLDSGTIIPGFRLFGMILDTSGANTRTHDEVQPCLGWNHDRFSLISTRTSIRGRFVGFLGLT